MAAKTRDAVLEVAQKVDREAKVSSIFPCDTGSFFRLTVTDTSAATDIVKAVTDMWPLLSASQAVSDLDGGVTVGVLVPGKRAAWRASLAGARSGVCFVLLGLVAKCLLMASVITFCWGVFLKLK